MDIKKLLNDVLNNCVSKNKVKLFYSYIKEYNLNEDDYIYIKKDTKCNKTNYHKIPIDKLKERLFKNITEVKDIKNLEVDDIDNEEIVFKKCKKIINKINYISKGNKKYFYYAGGYLIKLKENYNNEYLEEQLEIKINTINKYINFYSMCYDNNILLECDLSYTDIVNNYVEIKELLKLVNFSNGENFSNREN